MFGFYQPANIGSLRKYINNCIKIPIRNITPVKYGIKHCYSFTQFIDLKLKTCDKQACLIEEVF